MNERPTTTRMIAHRARGRLFAGVTAFGLLATLAVVAPFDPVPVATAFSGASTAVPGGLASTATTARSITLPRGSSTVGVIADWELVGSETIAEVGPVVGSVKSGAVALGVDAPVVSKATDVAKVVASVQPNTQYTFEAYVRLMSKTPKTVGVAIKVGSSTVTLPKLDATWKRVTRTFTTGPDDVSTTVAMRVSRAVRGFAVDAVALYPTVDAAKTNVVPNGSFEDVDVKRGIASRSLVMSTATAALAVALPTGAVAWEVLRSGKRVAKGTASQKGVLASVPLSGVKQGYYTVKVRASDGKTITTTIAVIDSPHSWITTDKRYGVGLHVESDIYADAARHVSALGIAEARNDVRWAPTERVKGEYDFSLYDGPFAKLKAQGVKTLGIVNYGNIVYGKTNQFAPVSAAAITAYGKYAARVADRFDLAGLEVFNEFNWPEHNKSKCRTAKCYLALVKAVHSSVAKVDPSLPIVVGATAKYPAAWFDDLWKRGGLKYTDAASFHPYEITGSPEGLVGIVKRSKASMKKYGKTTKPVWITELGTSSYTGNRTPTEQASVLVRSSVTAFAAGVKKFYWYDLINDFPGKTLPQGNFGLYSYPAKGVAAVAPKQAGFAQALTITQLGNRSYRGAQKLGTGVVSQAFGSTKDSVSVVWSPKGTKTATFKTAKSVVLVKFDGTKTTLKPKKGVVKFAVTKNPVFLRVGAATAGVTK